MELLDIGEVVARSGVPASTLRYWESRGLIESSGRKGIRRQFAPDTLDQLALINLGQAAGFALDEIAEMFSPDRTPDINRSALLAKADELDRTIGHLEAMRDGLRHAAACPAPRHMECRSFKRLLRTAAAGRLPTAPAAAQPRR